MTFQSRMLSVLSSLPDIGRIKLEANLVLDNRKSIFCSIRRGHWVGFTHKSGWVRNFHASDGLSKKISHFLSLNVYYGGLGWVAQVA